MYKRGTSEKRGAWSDDHWHNERIDSRMRNGRCHVHDFCNFALIRNMALHGLEGAEMHWPLFTSSWWRFLTCSSRRVVRMAWMMIRIQWPWVEVVGHDGGEEGEWTMARKNWKMEGVEGIEEGERLRQREMEGPMMKLTDVLGADSKLHT